MDHRAKILERIVVQDEERKPNIKAIVVKIEPELGGFVYTILPEQTMTHYSQERRGPDGEVVIPDYEAAYSLGVVDVGELLTHEIDYIREFALKHQDALIDDEFGLSEEELQAKASQEELLKKIDDIDEDGSFDEILDSLLGPLKP